MSGLKTMLNSFLEASCARWVNKAEMVSKQFVISLSLQDALQFSKDLDISSATLNWTVSVELSFLSARSSVIWSIQSRLLSPSKYFRT